MKNFDQRQNVVKLCNALEKANVAFQTGTYSGTIFFTLLDVVRCELSVDPDGTLSGWDEGDIAFDTIEEAVDWATEMVNE